jgi:predicted small metal-binding protein
MSMRVVECNICGEALSGTTDEELLGRMRQHMESEHSSMTFDEAAARDTIANEAYDASDS